MPHINWYVITTVLQMEIFDAYVEDLIRQDKAKEKKGKASNTQEEERKKPLQSDLQSDDITRVARAAKVMERMVNQNTFDDIAQGVYMAANHNCPEGPPLVIKHFPMYQSIVSSPTHQISSTMRM